MPRTPPPEFSVRTYPVPVIADQVVVEWVTSELANSKPIEPGAPHPNTREFAGFKLGIQRVNPQDPYFTQRIWVTDATNQDLYNYALKYLSESASHPIFIRSYREPKIGYTRRANGSALQVVYKLARTLAGTGYTPGTQPALTFAGGAGTGAAGHGVVAPDGTIAEFVLTNGGSGYTSAPTFTVAAPPSGVTATGSAYIQPTTAILVSEEALLYPQESEFYADSFNVMRVYETLPGPILNDQEYDQQWDVAIPSTRQIVKNSDITLGTNRQQIKAIDSVKSELTTYDPTLLAAVFDSYVLSFPNTTNLQLPDVLTGITVLRNLASGKGDYAETSSGSGVGTTFYYSMHAQGSAQGSASAQLDLAIEIKQYWARNVPTTSYFFFQQSPTVATILARMQTLLGATLVSWPKFVPQAHTLICKGQKISAEAKAKTGFQASQSSDGASATVTGGSGTSRDVSTSMRAVHIPPTLHGAIDLAGGVGGEYTVVPEYITASATRPGVTMSANAGDIMAFASIHPTSLPATSPTGISNSGFFILHAEASPYRFGYAGVSVEVVDASNIV